MVKLNYKKKHIKKHPTTRTGIKLIRVQAIVDHWTANYGASALNHFKYFNTTLPNLNDNLPENKKRYATAHIFVDKNEALELVPLDEVCFGANDGGTPGLKLSTLRATHPQYKEGNANLLCLHVEMCVEEDGTIHPDTIARTALVHQYLQKKFPQLKDTKNRIVRHFDVTGKNCPAPMISDASKWNELLELTDAKVVIPPKNPAEVIPEEKPSNPENKTNWLRSKTEGLRYYDTPSWLDKDVAGRLQKGYGFPQTVRKIWVKDPRDNSAAWQYEVKNSRGKVFYVTAAEKHVSVEREAAKSTAKKPLPPKQRGPKPIGEITIIGVSNAAIIQDRPDRLKSKNLGTIDKGKKIKVTGSVRGKNSTSGYWEVIFKGRLGYVTGEFGKYYSY
ncbi:N-acetylmuramoyl-L-alanine amidase family protein [Rossellomorea sp. BNER]|uniref:peptidoglycan recognition protein family protein n=1 Tax=Rossellomorea sp. BNER TaxID=2962031 RepID=UPI003AF2C666|nr:N-acetylmuramoyl-L-alanine amidase [Rossellomorea sp. BNER]